MLVRSGNHDGGGGQMCGRVLASEIRPARKYQKYLEEVGQEECFPGEVGRSYPPKEEEKLPRRQEAHH